MTKSKFNYRQLTTKIGLPIYFMNLPHAPTVGVGVLVKAGTREETWPAEAGLAHALEHMVFQGTKRFPTSHKVSAYIEDIGGIVNAWTTKEMTFFWRQVPAQYVERAFISLADHRPVKRLLRLTQLALIPLGLDEEETGIDDENSDHRQTDLVDDVKQLVEQKDDT